MMEDLWEEITRYLVKHGRNPLSVDGEQTDGADAYYRMDFKRGGEKVVLYAIDVEKKGFVHERALLDVSLLGQGTLFSRTVYKTTIAESIEALLCAKHAIEEWEDDTPRQFLHSGKLD